LKQDKRIEKLEVQLGKLPVEFNEEEIKFIIENMSKNPVKVVDFLKKEKPKSLRFIKDPVDREVKILKAFFSLLPKSYADAVKMHLSAELSL
jgi:hypothetical protein